MSPVFGLITFPLVGQGSITLRSCGHQGRRRGHGSLQEIFALVMETNPRAGKFINPCGFPNMISPTLYLGGFDH